MDTRRRATIAAIVGLVGATIMVAGVGHVYLRKWRRAAMWFVGGVAAFAILVTVFADPTATTMETLPLTVLAPYFLFLTLSVADAYVVAQRATTSSSALPDSLGISETDADESGVTCPSCGRAAATDLQFCWYCAAPIQEPSERE